MPHATHTCRTSCRDISWSPTQDVQYSNGMEISGCKSARVSIFTCLGHVRAYLDVATYNYAGYVSHISEHVCSGFHGCELCIFTHYIETKENSKENIVSE
jgi:hypothetical protein